MQWRPRTCQKEEGEKIVIPPKRERGGGTEREHFKKETTAPSDEEEKSLEKRNEVSAGEKKGRGTRELYALRIKS